MVPKAGLEPAHPKAVDFESTASTDFATSALKGSENGSDYTCQKSIRNTYPFNFVQALKKESVAPLFHHLCLKLTQLFTSTAHVSLLLFCSANRQPTNSLYNSKQYTAMREIIMTIISWIFTGILLGLVIGAILAIFKKNK